MKEVVIIRYNAGNIFSVSHALRRLGVEPVLTDDPERIRQAERVIFPGVGEASSAMRYLRDRGLDEVIRGLTQPFPGICLGLQLLCEHSEEGDTDCIGVFPQRVRKFPQRDKVPHMGWNRVRFRKDDLFEGVPEGSYMYFVHSFYAEEGEETAVHCDYILPFSAGLRRDNFHALQFHPEKSGVLGERILANFIGAGR